MKVRMKATEVGTVPPIAVYTIELYDDDGVWEETYGSRAEVDAFLRGVKAASSMASSPLLNLSDHVTFDALLADDRKRGLCEHGHPILNGGRRTCGIDHADEA